ncbi:MAG: hypothetical protein ACR2K0_05305 [Acidimicrobiales bacterium]
MSKQRQRQRQRARRARQEHGRQKAATAGGRRSKRMGKVAVALIATLAILFLGVLGALLQEASGQPAGAPITTKAPLSAVEAP